MPKLSLPQLRVICQAIWDNTAEGYNGECSESTEEEITAYIDAIISEELAKIEKE